MKLDYELANTDEDTAIWVYYRRGERDWIMRMYRDKQTLNISKPDYMYSPNQQEPFEEEERIPRSVQAYFDAAMPKVKTLLILGSN